MRENGQPCRRAILTAEMYAEIPALIEQGFTKIDIAQRFGVKLAPEPVLNNRLISYPLGPGSLGRKRTLTLPEAPLDLSDATMTALRKKARSMGTCEVRLARDLMETIVADDLYSAVLDLEVA